MGFSQEDVRVRDTRITLKRGGSGPTLLYLHGANGAPAVRPFMELIAQNYEVLVPEHPGFGASEERAWLDNIHDLAYFYLDFIDQLELRDVHLVGSSIGGWLALEIAVRDVSRLRRLTAGGPRRPYPPGSKRPRPLPPAPGQKGRHPVHAPQRP